MGDRTDDLPPRVGGGGDGRRARVPASAGAASGEWACARGWRRQESPPFCVFDPPRFDGNGTQFAWYHIEKTGLMFEKDWKVAALAHGLSVRRVLLPHVEVHTRFRLLLVVREPRAHTRSLWHQTCAHGGPGNTPLPSCPRFGEWVRRWRDWRGGKGGEVPKGWGGGPIDYQHEALRIALHQNPNYSPDPGEPDVAVRTSAFAVGLTELFHESLCVFHGLLAATDGRYPPGCDCRDAAAWAAYNRTRDDVGNSHSVDRSADATAYDEAGVGAAVDEMTRKDRALFGVAARRLFRDARRVEKERNTRIFCGDSRRALQRYAAIRLNRTLA